MKIELTNNRIPSGIKTFYAVQGLRSGYVKSRWTDGAEAEAEADAINKAIAHWAPGRVHVVKLHV